MFQSVAAVPKLSYIPSFPTIWLFSACSLLWARKSPYCLTEFESLAAETWLMSNKTFSQHSSSYTPPPLGLCTLLTVASPRCLHRMTSAQSQLLGRDHNSQCWSWWMLMCRWAPLYQIYVFMATAEKSLQMSNLQAPGASLAGCEDTRGRV